MTGTLHKQFKQRGYKYKSIVRPRPEEKYLNKGYDFTEQLREIEPGIKKLIFEKLYCAKENWPNVFTASNIEIMEDMKLFTNGELSSLEPEAFCQYIDDWKGINLTGSGCDTEEHF